MKVFVAALALLVSALILGFIAWATGGSLPALVAGLLFLGLGAALGAASVGILPMPAPVFGMLSLAIILCLGVITWAGVENWLDNQPKTPEAAIANTPTPSTALVEEKARKTGWQPTHLSYGADGCVEHEVVVWHFYWHLEGGSAKTYPPHGAEPFTDKPGKKVITELEPGLWKWCRAEPDATGLMLWEYFEY
jgi:hypothetical protein